MTRASSPAYRTAAALAALAASLFMLASSGTTGSGDANVRYRVARALVRDGTVELPSGDPGGYPGRDGRRFALYGIGQSLLFALPEAAIVTTCAVVGSPCTEPVWRDISIGVASFVVLPVISGVGVGFLLLFLIELGMPRRPAGVATLLVAAGSLLFPYAKFHQEEAQIAALAFAAAYFCVRFERHGRPRDARLAAVLLVLPLWFRMPGAAVTIPVGGVLLLAAWRSPSTRARSAAIAALTGAGAVTAAWLMFYNWYRFGGVLSTGYVEAWQASGRVHQDSRMWADVASGLAGPLVHPSRSLLLYSPLVLLAVKAAALAWRERPVRPWIAAAAAALAISIAMPSALAHWGGDTAWGPRYQVAGHALLLAFVAYFWRDRHLLSRTWRAAGTAVAAAAIAVQLAGVAYNYNLDYALGLKPTSASEARFFDVRYAQLAVRAEAIARFGGGWIHPPTPAPRSDVEEYSVPALLAWKLGQRFGPSAWAVAAVLWLAACAAWLAWCVRVTRQLGDSPADCAVALRGATRPVVNA